MARTCQVSMHDGQVACPHQGLIEVELCYQCPRLRAFYDEETGTKVVCSVPLAVRLFGSLARPEKHPRASGVGS
jgi:hypothetical protein